MLYTIFFDILRHYFPSSNKLRKRRMISVILKRRNQVNCIDVIVITTKILFTVYSAVRAGDAGSAAASPGDAAASPGKFFLGKFERNLT